MLFRLRRRLDNLDSQIEERRSVPKKDTGSLNAKEIARILNYIHMRGLRPNATANQREASRLVAKKFFRGEKLTEDEQSWMVSPRHR